MKKLIEIIFLNYSYNNLYKRADILFEVKKNKTKQQQQQQQKNIMWIQNCYKLKTVGQCYYQELYVAKKKDLWKSKKQKHD